MASLTPYRDLTIRGFRARPLRHTAEQSFQTSVKFLLANASIGASFRTRRLRRWRERRRLETQDRRR
jgi:hypothetical protein